MKKMKPGLDAMVGTGLILGLFGVSGCSDSANVSTSKKVAESRREEIQKPTQSGVPDTKGATKGKAR